MKQRYVNFIVILLMAAAVPEPAFCAETATSGLRTPSEHYEYIIRPLSDTARVHESKIVFELYKENGVILLTKKSSQDERGELIDIRVKDDGTFITGTRQYEDRPDYLESISLRAGTVLTARGSLKSGKIKHLRLEPGKLFAADISLLYLFRNFPFGRGVQWDVLMMDFSRYSITVAAKESGEELVKVPAGEFECYRMEVTVNALLIHPKITYWLSKDPPHFLVKHIGKVGPFTRQFITELVKRD